MKGVLYQLSGIKSAPCLVTSLVQLRKHYAGEVTIVCTSDVRTTVELIEMDERLAPVKHIDLGTTPVSRTPHFTFKSWTYQVSPYRTRTVYLDTDTIVRAPLDGLFELDAEVAICEMCPGYGMAGGHRYSRFFSAKMRNGFARFGPVVERQVNDMIRANAPIFNAGVLSFRLPSVILDMTLYIAMAGTQDKVDDEMAMQLLATQHPDRVHVLPPSWNANYRYCRTQYDDAKIWHFHNHNWARGKGAQLYRQFATEAVKGRYAQVDKWWRSADKKFEDAL